jgi:hypothetical protein
MLAASEKLRKGEQMRQNASLRAAGVLTVVLAVALLLAAAAPARADGFRSITTVTGDYYFANDTSGASYYIETDEVFLARVLPMLTVEAKVTRNDFIGGPQHIFYLGPVVTFTDTLYLVAAYGLGIDSSLRLLHEADLDFNWETDLAAAFASVKVVYFTADSTWYALPSIGGRFHMTPKLGIFGEYFMSYNNLRQLTGAFWGQADYAISPVFTLLGGFTFSYSRNLGFSIIAGTNLTLTDAISLQYKFSFLSNVVQYLTESSPTTSYGVENLVSLDWKF